MENQYGPAVPNQLRPVNFVIWLAATAQDVEYRSFTLAGGGLHHEQVYNPEDLEDHLEDGMRAGVTKIP